MEFLKRLHFTSTVQEKYLQAGEQVSDALSYMYAGDVVGFDQMVEEWKSWEKEYARRGYRTISLDKFNAALGSREALSGLIGKTRDEGEQPILHAERFIARYRGTKRTDAIDLDARVNAERTEAHGTYQMPGTEEETDTKQ
ncbi:hypothetical protein C4580_00975 [Candidatus Woesearchaeota archaeon]|nr:MAG: hypothetical protein C4580_00975 [Candidatus Woesearchaeota archaeon]